MQLISYSYIKLYFVQCSLLLVGLSSASFAQQPTLGEDWKLASVKNDIKTYTRSQQATNVKEIRISAQVRASPKELFVILNDVPNYQHWVYRCTYAKTLQTINEDELYFYSETNFPFPLSNRDLIVHSRNWQDPNTGIFYTHTVSTPDYLPEKKGLVRIKDFESYWIITPNPDGSTTVDYLMKTGMGGRVPDSIFNLIVATGPRKSIENLKKMVKSMQQRVARK